MGTRVGGRATYETGVVHTRGFFSLRKILSGKRESLSYLHFEFDEKTHEQSGNAEPCARQKNRARTEGEKGRYNLLPRRVQEIAEGNTSYEQGWRVKVMIKKIDEKGGNLNC